ncbi:MAG TPA: PKD domain-containing protein [Solirubrobacteraceae bacterium]|jgi:hypothetical protein
MPVFAVLASVLGCALATLGAGSAGAAVLSGPRGIVPARSLAQRVFGVPVHGGPRPSPQRASRVAPASDPVATLEYQGGPVMHTNRVYTIFWQPNPLPAGVTAFKTSPSYQGTVDKYFERVAGDSHGFSNVYSTATQYYSGAANPIEYATSFGGSTVDEDALPAKECTDLESPGAAEELKACLTEQQIQEEIAHVVSVQHWTAGPESLFFLYTPKGVGSCFKVGAEREANQCAYTYYCAYHGNFRVSSEEFLFANMPYEQTPTCDDRARPEGSDAGPAIDTTSHEHIEAITDPTGTSWWDNHGSEESNPYFGQEIGDLCLPLEFSASFASEVYGPLLDGSTYETAGAHNQLIGAHDYLLQREWSDAAGPSVGGSTPGGCVQLLLPAAFTAPAAAQATQPASFDGSTAGTSEDPATSWGWNFGDGSAGAGPAPVHTYAAAGLYTVTLTVADARGDTNTTSQRVSIASAPSEEVTSTTTSTSTSPSTTTTTSTSTSTATSTFSTSSLRAHLSSIELAALLGLPGSAPVAGAGAASIVLGHASCPPACSLTVNLYAVAHLSRHHHRFGRRTLVGRARLSLAAGAAAPLAIRLNATGRALLRAGRRLVVELTISATDSQGVATLLTRRLTLTLPRRAAHRRH